jgi:hypothetical protein
MTDYEPIWFTAITATHLTVYGLDDQGRVWVYNPGKSVWVPLRMRIETEPEPSR